MKLLTRNEGLLNLIKVKVSSPGSRWSLGQITLVPAQDASETLQRTRTHCARR